MLRRSGKNDVNSFRVNGKFINYMNRLSCGINFYLTFNFYNRDDYVTDTVYIKLLSCLDQGEIDSKRGD